MISTDVKTLRLREDHRLGLMYTSLLAKSRVLETQHSDRLLSLETSVAENVNSFFNGIKASFRNENVNVSASTRQTKTNQNP